MNDTVTITRLVLPIRMGCHQKERTTTQPIRIDLAIETDFTDVLASGDLKQGVDYVIVRRQIKTIAKLGEFPLLEDLGMEIFEKIFRNRRIASAKISIRKLARWKDAFPGIIMMRRNPRAQ